MTQQMPQAGKNEVAAIKPGMQGRTWLRPAVTRMRAGDAEIGPNPDNADGAFTFS